MGRRRFTTSTNHNTPMPNKIYLQWYRDPWLWGDDRGQRAADAEGARQVIDCWPIAQLDCTDPADANRKWDHLHKTYGINATTYHVPAPVAQAA